MKSHDEDFKPLGHPQLINIGFQIGNAVFFFSDAYRPFVSHILILFVLIVYEGLLGGAAYVNTFRAVHSQVRRMGIR